MQQQLQTGFGRFQLSSIRPRPSSLTHS